MGCLRPNPTVLHLSNLAGEDRGRNARWFAATACLALGTGARSRAWREKGEAFEPFASRRGFNTKKQNKQSNKQTNKKQTNKQTPTPNPRPPTQRERERERDGFPNNKPRGKPKQLREDQAQQLLVNLESACNHHRQREILHDQVVVHAVPGRQREWKQHISLQAAEDRHTHWALSSIWL